MSCLIVLKGIGEQVSWVPVTKHTLMLWHSLMVVTSYLDDEEKKIEHAVALDSRKEAFGEQYIYYPPWRKFP